MTSNNLKVNTNIFEIDRKQFKYSSNRLTDLKKNSNFHQIRPSSGQTYQPPPIQIEKDKPTNLRPINKKFDRISAPWEYIFKNKPIESTWPQTPDCVIVGFWRWTGVQIWRQKATWQTGSQTDRSIYRSDPGCRVGREIRMVSKIVLVLMNVIVIRLICIEGKSFLKNVELIRMYYCFQVESAISV